MVKKKFKYTGQNNLESMSCAVNYNKFLLSLVKKYAKDKDTKILDFGSGIGTHCSSLLNDGYKNIDCLEIDHDQASALSEKGFKTYTNISYANDDSYDLIYSFDVFEHIANDSEVFSELFLKLKKGGKIITYVPAAQVLFSEMDHLVEHERRYDANSIRRLFRLTKNRKTIAQGYVDPLGFIMSFAYNKIFFRKNNGHLSSSQVKFYDRHIFPKSLKLSVLTKNIFGKSVYNVSIRIK